jgi:hypothetical protein
MLAQELYAMFQQDVPLEHSGPITLNSENPLTIKRPDFSDGPALTFKRGDETWGFRFDGGKLVLYGPNLNADLQEVTGNLTPSTGQTGTQQQDKKKDDEQKPSSGSFPGVITAGSGDTYTVSVYTDGLTLTPTEASVKQLSIDPAATIKAGTWVLVARSAGGEYTMQSPVWGAD